MDRDYTLNYRVDTSQAGPAFAGMRTHLDEIRNKLHEITTAATGVNNSFGQIANNGMGALNGVSIHAAQAQSTFLGLETGVIKAAVAFKGLDLAAGIVMALGEAVNSARKHMADLVEDATKVGLAMRELASLRGESAPTPATTGAAAQFGINVGMEPEEAGRFLSRFKGSEVAGLIRGNVGDGRREGESQADYEKRVAPVLEDLATEGGRFGQRKGISHKTTGDVAGVMTQFGRVKDGKDLAQKFGRVSAALDDGRGDMEALMMSFSNTAGAIVDQGDGAAFKSVEDMSAFLGVMSMSHQPKEAGTYLKKAVRELREFNGPHKDALEKMGITPDMDFKQSMGRVKDAIDGSGKAPDQALQEMGFKDSAGIQAITEAYKGMAELPGRESRRDAVSGDQVLRDNDEFFSSNQIGISLRNKAEDAARDLIAGEAKMSWQNARASARNRLRNDGKIKDSGDFVMDKVKDLGPILPTLGFETTQQSRIDEEAVNHIMKLAEENGLGDEARAINPVQKNPGQSFDQLYSGRQHIGAELYQKLGPKLLAKKVDLYRGKDWELDFKIEENKYKDTDILRTGTLPGAAGTVPAVRQDAQRANDRARSHENFRQKRLFYGPGADAKFKAAGGTAGATTDGPDDMTKDAHPIPDKTAALETNALLKQILTAMGEQTGVIRDAAEGGAMPFQPATGAIRA